MEVVSESGIKTVAAEVYSETRILGVIRLRHILTFYTFTVSFDRVPTP